MGGGRDNSGAVRYYRRNGIYFRKDGKPVNHRFRNINITIEDHMALVNIAEPITPTIRAAMTPLPQTGKEVPDFVQRTLAIDDLNDKNSGNSISKRKRNNEHLYQKLIDGSINTPNGGFLFQEERPKNKAYLKYNNMPDYKEVLEQVIPQLTSENLKQVIPASDLSIIEGKTESSNLWVYETQITNKDGQNVRTYVKVYPFHSNEGKPYTILVSLHRTGPIRETATAEQKG